MCRRLAAAVFSPESTAVPILTIESTCDETAAAVIDARLQVLGACVASQDALHASYQGVVPEIAARAHLERILPVIDTALREAQLPGNQLTGIAVANTPGLAGSLLVGLSAAKTLAVAWGVPLLAINHLHAHVYACQLAEGRSVFPCVGFVVSGGHTTLYDCRDPLDFRTLGGTIDDAAGEAFDKVAAMVGLGYPGGPEVSRRAAGGNARRYDFPRSKIRDDDFNFSFSGLKTAVRYALVGPGKQDFSRVDLTESELADLCASFELAVVESLVAKAVRAVIHTGHGRLCVGGGVAANPRFRNALQHAAEDEHFELSIAPPQLCTDNAVMGAIAWEKLHRGQTEALDLDIEAGLVRGGR
jgi:N6-L-threonylcarbamoyladenine synthase